jgi:hypothetical protein
MSCWEERLREKMEESEEIDNSNWSDSSPAVQPAAHEGAFEHDIYCDEMLARGAAALNEEDEDE